MNLITIILAFLKTLRRSYIYCKSVNMKRKLLSLSLVIIALFQLTIISCSKDEVEPEKPIVVVPEEPKPEVPEVPVSTVPKSEIMKPAIRNISVSANKMGKRTVEQKRLVRSTQFAQNYMGHIYTYHYNTDLIGDYRTLPSENLYDPGEKELNVDTERDNVQIYKYNTSGQLTNIETETVFTNNGLTSNPEEFSFEYNSDGTLKQMISSYAYRGTYSYNDKGLIDKKIDVSGFVSHSYEYDDKGRIVSSYLYTNTANGRIPNMHYVYFYPDDTSYVKTWYEVSEDQTETNRSYVIYTYDPAKAGVYNKEPYYQIDNQYMHVVKLESHILYNGAWQLQFESVPKYFYDAEGYLIKYDSAGFNYTTDIRVYEYE